MKRNALRIVAPAAPVPPLAERGRMLYAEDVQALFGTKPDGRPRKSREWVLEQFCREKRHRLGRDVYWWECDVQAWFDRERAA
jgi:hypothetical protein